ncbi:hypothetical protein MPTK1_2g25090 [Marchantia polymorpha subsp. ruderalis]|uniref:Uncharacterized protein n=1 Tax=Marchantia polymorpha TaxID=3197 RepID=A0A2R6W354_MARPO|nr:hypothetical protein MARPO_0168s0024 [Marchantia polymorpha]BBN03642.1 hypothetical protein Mp_2g25090 [Marchantia polymorpha subsp. ruderalis]|eukprot:PTQ28300.1 hypothetical protein MARPO_0168s0024 [Marchantia polymorpha]
MERGETREPAKQLTPEGSTTLDKVSDVTKFVALDFQPPPSMWWAFHRPIHVALPFEDRRLVTVVDSHPSHRPRPPGPRPDPTRPCPEAGHAPGTELEQSGRDVRAEARRLHACTRSGRTHAIMAVRNAVGKGSQLIKCDTLFVPARFGETSQFV